MLAADLGKVFSARTLTVLSALVACSPADERPRGPDLSTEPDDDSNAERDAAPGPLQDAGLDGGASRIDAAAPIFSEDSGGVPLPDVDRDAGPGYCGDGRRFDETESCDGQDLGELTCSALGFDDGDLACSDVCQLDVAGCIGQESCSDGRDNDGDGLADCLDEDCDARCLVSCDEAVELDAEGLAQGLLISGTNLGHANEVEPSCASATGGAEVVYKVVSNLDGVLSVELESPTLLVASARRSCEAGTFVDAGAALDGGVVDAAEVACVPAGRSFQAPVSEGEVVFVSVDGRREGDQGNYSLRLALRTIVCGDGFRDIGEACDDGNANDSDGCSTNCQLNPTESEPNDEPDDADEFENPFYGAISSRDDVDVVRFDVQDDAVTLRTIDLGDGACALPSMDTILSVLNADGEVVVDDDDGGDGFCSRIELSDVAAGTYYAVVSASAFGTSDAFPYRLTVSPQ